MDDPVQGQKPETWPESGIRDLPVASCAIDGTAFRLGHPENREAGEIDWSEVKLITFGVALVDKEGMACPWTKACWVPSKDATMKVKKDWKMFMRGMKSALQMLRPGETSWFSLPKEGQLCDYLIRYPVQDDHLFARISLKEVQFKTYKEPKGYDPISQFSKLLKLKDEADKEYSKHKNIALGIDRYTKLWNKHTGLLSSISKDEQFQGLLEKAKQEVIKIRNNLGLVHLKDKNYEEALRHLDFVLSNSPSNVKALHRKAHCVEALGSLEESLLYFRRVKDLEGINRVQFKINTRNSSFLNNLKNRGLFY